MKFDALNRPLHIGTLNLKNRVVMAPMSRNLSPNHIPDATVAQYYQRRARGGVGLIITEASAIDHPAAQGAFAHAGGAKFAPDFTQRSARQWKSVVEAVKVYDTKIFAQFWHVGSTREPSLSFNPEVPAYGPSAIKHPRFDSQNGVVPQAMRKKDIADHVEAYAKAALQAKEIGFDGIELNAAHGYGIDQFFWSETNKRTDEYGGSTLIQRTRFATDIIKAIKDKVGNDFPISLRISQWKMGAYDYQMIQNEKILHAFIQILSNAGVDVFHISTRFFDQTFLDTGKTLAALVKEASNKPVIAVGSIATETDLIGSLRQNESGQFSLNRLQKATEMIANKEIDLLAIGRPLLADPNWYKKVINNQYDDIIPFKKSMINTLDKHLGDTQ